MPETLSAEPGVEVVLKGLKNKPTMNGSHGRVVGFKDVQQGGSVVPAVMVHFGKEAMFFFPENLLVVPNSKIEMRIDETDGALYTKEEFKEYYKEKTDEVWKKSKKFVMSQPLLCDVYSGDDTPKPKPKKKKAKPKTAKKKPVTTEEDEEEEEPKPKKKKPSKKKAAKKPSKKKSSKSEPSDADSPKDESEEEETPAPKKKRKKKQPPKPASEPSEPASEPESKSNHSGEEDESPKKAKKEKKAKKKKEPPPPPSSSSESSDDGESERERQAEEERRRQEKEDRKREKEEAKRKKAEEKQRKREEEEERRRKEAEAESSSSSSLSSSDSEERRREEEAARKAEERRLAKEEKRRAKEERREEKKRLKEEKRQQEQADQQQPQEEDPPDNASKGSKDDDGDPGKQDDKNTDEPEPQKEGEGDQQEQQEQQPEQSTEDNKPADEDNTDDKKPPDDKEEQPPEVTNMSLNSLIQNDNADAQSKTSSKSNKSNINEDPPPPPDSPPPDPTGGMQPSRDITSSDPLRRRAVLATELENFYKKHDPSKSSDSWTLAGSYLNKETDLFKKLIKQHPTAVDDLDWLLDTVVGKKPTVPEVDSDDESITSSVSEGSPPPPPPPPEDQQQNDFLSQYIASPYDKISKKVYSASPKELLRRSLETHLKNTDQRILSYVDTEALAGMFAGKESELENALMAAAGGAKSAKTGYLHNPINRNTSYRSSGIVAPSMHQSAYVSPLSARAGYAPVTRSPATSVPPPQLNLGFNQPSLLSKLSPQPQNESATQTGGHAVRSATTAVQCGAPKVSPGGSKRPSGRSSRQQQDTDDLQDLIAQLQYEEQKVRELTRKTQTDAPGLIENVRATTELLQKTMSGVQEVMSHQQQREANIEPTVKWSSPAHEGYRQTPTDVDGDGDSSDSEINEQIDEFLRNAELLEKYSYQATSSPPSPPPPPPEPPRSSHKAQSPQMSDLESQMQELLQQQKALEDKLGVNSSGQYIPSKRKVIDSGETLVDSLRTADTLLQQQQLSLLQHQERELQRVAHVGAQGVPPPSLPQPVVQYQPVPNPPPRRKHTTALPTNPYMIL